MRIVVRERLGRRRRRARLLLSAAVALGTTTTVVLALLLVQARRAVEGLLRDNAALGRVLAEARQGQDAHRTAALEVEIDALFAELVASCDGRQTERPFECVRQLDARLQVAEWSSIHRERLATWRQRRADLGEIFLAVRLHGDLAQANALLRAMCAASEVGDLDAVDRGFEELQRLVTRMRSEQRDAFHRHAEGALDRGLAVLARAHTDAHAPSRLRLLDQYALGSYAALSQVAAATYAFDFDAAEAGLVKAERILEQARGKVAWLSRWR